MRTQESRITPSDFGNRFRRKAQTSAVATWLLLASIGGVASAHASSRHDVSSSVRAIDANTAKIDAVSAVNATPIAGNDVYTGIQDVGMSVAAPGVLANDLDADGDSLSAVLDSDAMDGMLTLNADGSFIYRGNVGFVGIDWFTYHVSDGTTSSAPVIVVINVNAPGSGLAPSAGGDAYTVIGGHPLFVGSPGVLANDTDPEGYSIQSQLVDGGGPQHGTLTLSTDGSFLYIPAPGYVGTDSFTYVVSDSSLLSAPATITLDIVSPGGGGAPVAVNDAYHAISGHDLVLGTGAILNNDIDPEGDALSALLTSLPTHGTLMFGSDGGFRYTPDESYLAGTDSFTYRATDGQSMSAPATVTITITPKGGIHPPVANDDAYSMTSGGTLVIRAANGVLVNDLDEDGDFLIAGLISSTQHGAVNFFPDGTFRYRADSGFVGVESFLYFATDGKFSSTATVVIDVNGTNHAPVAEPAFALTQQNAPIALSLHAVDEDGDALEYTITTPLNHGGTLSGAMPDLIYAPAQGFNGIETFAFKANDGAADSNIAVVTITVGNGGAGNQSPVAVGQQLYTPANMPLPIGLTATDPEGDLLQFVIVAAPDHGGQLSGSLPQITYQPATGFNGVETFKFLANDGQVDSNTAAVTITVGDGGPGNQPPVAVSQALATPVNTPLNLALNAIDPEQSPVTYEIVSAPVRGGALAGSIPNLTYTPPTGFTGTDIFTFRANDGQFDSNVATVTITVGGGSGGNVAPTIADQTFEIADNVAVNTIVGTVAATDDGQIQPLSYSITAGNIGGAFSIDSANGKLRVAAPLDHDSVPSYALTVQVSDGELSAAATIRVDVTDGSTNAPPVIAGGQTFAVPEGAGIGDVVDTVEASDDGLPQPPGALTYQIVSGNIGGAFSIAAASGEIRVAGPLDFESRPSYALTVSVSDGALSTEAAVTIDVTDVVGGPGIESVPPIVVDDAIQVAPGGTATMLIDGSESVLDNDIDIDGDLPLVAQLVSAPSSGTLSLDADGRFSYSNTVATAETDSFEYEACDTEGVCSTGIVTITLSDGPLNHVPVATDDAIALAPGGSATVLVGDATSVLANDSDPDDDALDAMLLLSPSHGMLNLNPDGSFVYTNDDDDPAAEDFFYYEACDSFRACALAKVSISIAADLPLTTCILPTQIAEVGDSILIELSTLFTPPSGQGLSYGIEALPASLGVDANSGRLSGTLASGDEIGSPYLGLLRATTVPGGGTASQAVRFVVLPEGDILLRNGFDGPAAPQGCQSPSP